MAQQQFGSVQGVVTSIGGEPLRKAEVILRSTGREAQAFSLTTDPSGVFSFGSLPPGNYAISAQRAGYVRGENSRRGSALQAITIAPGQAVSGITLKLTPHCIITGRIVDEDGDPMFGATVSILEERYFRGRRSFAPRTRSGVNDLG